MAITYTSQVGTTFTTYAANETLGDQTQQTGNNTVVVSNAITVTPPGNGQIGTKYSSYVGRTIFINLAGTIQKRKCISQSNGTGTTKILTVNENWSTNPISGNTIHVTYMVDDAETGGVSTGIQLNTRTGLYEWLNFAIVGDGTNPAGVELGPGEAMELSDEGTSASCIVKNNGRLIIGYVQGGSAIAGGITTIVNAVDGNPSFQFQSGAKGEICDSLIWSQVNSLLLECASGSGIVFRGVRFLNTTYGTPFFGASIYDCSITGKKATTELIRLDSSSMVVGFVLVKTAGLTTASGSTTTETITVKNVVFVDNYYLISINSNKTWYIINPTWAVTTYSGFNWLTSTSNYVYDQRSIDAIVQKADDTKIQNANVLIYEGTVLDDLVLETYTNSSGVAMGIFTYKKHSTNSSTITYGGHALRVDCWSYFPFVSTQVSTSLFNGVVVLFLDSNIEAASQSDALTAGSGIIWNKDTNPSSIIEYSGGSGTLSVGNTVTASPSGATGIVTKIVDGDSITGTVHLKTRNATAFASGDSLSNGAGWTASYSIGSQKNFTIWIDSINKSMQITHDYLAALTSQTTLSATGELIHEWGKYNQTRALYKGIDGFYTERSGTSGIFITNFGTGTIEKFTANDGTTWTPPFKVDTIITAKTLGGSNIQDAQVLLKAASGGSMPYDVTVTITRSGSTATVSHTTHNMASNDKVQIKGANQQEYNGVYSITKINNDSYSYTVSGTPATPATGTIKATYVAVLGTTDINGQVSASRAFSANQPISGRIRKGTSSPYYRTLDVIGTIDKDFGLDMTVQMVSDE